MAIKSQLNITLVCDKCGKELVYEADGFVPDSWLEEYMDSERWEYETRNDDRDYYIECDKCSGNVKDKDEYTSDKYVYVKERKCSEKGCPYFRIESEHHPHSSIDSEICSVDNVWAGRMKKHYGGRSFERVCKFKSEKALKESLLKRLKQDKKEQKESLKRCEEDL